MEKLSEQIILDLIVRGLNSYHHAACCLRVVIATFQICNSIEESLNFKILFSYFSTCISLFISKVKLCLLVISLASGNLAHPQPNLFISLVFSPNFNFHQNHRLLYLLACMLTSNKYLLFFFQVMIAQFAYGIWTTKLVYRK